MRESRQEEKERRRKIESEIYLYLNELEDLCDERFGISEEKILETVRMLRRFVEKPFYVPSFLVPNPKSREEAKAFLRALRYGLEWKLTPSQEVFDCVKRSFFSFVEEAGLMDAYRAIGSRYEFGKVKWFLERGEKVVRIEKTSEKVCCDYGIEVYNYYTDRNKLITFSPDAGYYCPECGYEIYYPPGAKEVGRVSDDPHLSALDGDRDEEAEMRM